MATAHNRRRMRSRPPERRWRAAGYFCGLSRIELVGSASHRSSSETLAHDPAEGLFSVSVTNQMQRDFEMNQNIHQQRPSILQLRTVLERTGLSRSTIYALVRTGAFPRQIALGPWSVGWLESDVEAWISARVALTRH